MSDKNFDSIKNFVVPQSWVDNALNVPNTTHRKKPIVFLNFSRYATAVAVLLLVCALSIVVFFMPDDNIVEPDNKEKVDSTSITQSAESSANTAKSDDATTATSKELMITPNKTPTTKSNNIEPTEKSTTKDQKTDNSKSDPRPSTQEETKTTQSTNALSATTPTQNQTQMSTIKPTQKPTEKSTQAPTQKPTQKPTEKPTQVPTQKPTSTVGGDGYNTTEAIICSDSFSTAKLVGSGKVYCSLYSSSGKLLGDINLFSSQHLATIDYKTSSIVLVSYDPLSRGLLLSQGRYTYCFYNENGVVVAQGYLTVF